MVFGVVVVVFGVVVVVFGPDSGVNVTLGFVVEVAGVVNVALAPVIMSLAGFDGLGVGVEGVVTAVLGSKVSFLASLTTSLITSLDTGAPPVVNAGLVTASLLPGRGLSA